MALQPKRVAFFDIDNTLVRGSSLYFLSKAMYQRGFFNKRDIAAFVLANLRYQLVGERNQDEVDRIQTAALRVVAGHNVQELLDMGNDVYDRYVSPALWQGTLEIAQEHLARGEEVWLVSASPVEMADLIAKRLGFTGALGTCAEEINGQYTGKINGHLLHGTEKARAIAKLANEENIDLKNSYGYSDSHNDIPLLEAVGKPCVINPDTLLRIRAAKDQWPIYDFRRGRWFKKIVAPVINRAAAVAGALNPALRRRK
jgi:HAD superfamily hydrolase (TIGR01490 family)